MDRLEEAERRLLALKFKKVEQDHFRTLKKIIFKENIRKRTIPFSEFEVQAKAFIILQNYYGEDRVRGEVTYNNFGRAITLKCGKKYSGMKYICNRIKMDIAIYDKDENLELILEVKKSKGSPKRRGPRAQKIRYEKVTGCRTIYIRGMKEAENVLNIVKEYITE